MNCSTPGLPGHHQLLEFTQTRVHGVSDAIQPSHPLSSPSPAPNPSQHQNLFQWVNPVIGDSKWIPVFIGKGEKKARKSLSSFFTPCPPAKAHEKALRLYPLGDLLTLAVTGVTDLIGQSVKLIRPHLQRAWPANVHPPAVPPVPRGLISPQVCCTGTGTAPPPPLCRTPHRTECEV